MSTLRVIDRGEQVAFSYESVAVDVATEARQAAERINLRLRRTAEDVVEIGRDLTRMKERLPHGSFLPWISAEFGMSDQTARRFMQVTKVFASKSNMLLNLDASALYELAAPKTPIEVREEVERMIEAGEVVRSADVAELKRQHAASEAAKFSADLDAEKATAKAGELQSDFDIKIAEAVAVAARKIEDGYLAKQAQLDEQIAKLRSENARLKAGPVTAPIIDHDTGNVVSFTPRSLTEALAAEIDAEHDEHVDAEFNETANPEKRARVVVGVCRQIVAVKADPRSVFRGMTQGKPEQIIAENKAMIETAFSLFKSIKDQFDGKPRR
ncbi:MULTISPECIES: DUF3102 domain-containing protein [unclassified Aureimonas]|uniref:DUF3102 domain-containing protein n=1 Tax=unclassified Aureimonas TaxID=2615206 RepID=UPI0007017DCB|nr:MULTISPECIES: DUF3102 domain-containing protein [unclassified Aureimonas]KQT52186.1 hypothetical protein ASG62_16135 [Aureimonas sp. Leaf427]KQT70581.1 hypothetical protein ASG54_21815 [Aureimonas sp. Leaf460]